MDTTMYSWAELECRIACKRKNSKYNFDDDSEENFDYGCSCYKSALKAYNALCEDGHSGTSWNITRNILERLVAGKPLTPITDEDFFLTKEGTRERPMESGVFLKEMGLKSSMQCPRMSSLFRDKDLDGNISYNDVDRCVHVNVEHPSETYHSSDDIINEMFPIEMPYMPPTKPYRQYEQTFLTDKKNGDFDTRGVLYIITPEGKRIDVNRYFTTPESGRGWVEISKEEYDILLEKRIDTIEHCVCNRILWNIEYFLPNSENKDLKISDDVYDEIFDRCKIFRNPEMWQYNTYAGMDWLCGATIDYETESKMSSYKELVNLREYIKEITYKLLSENQEK